MFGGEGVTYLGDINHYIYSHCNDFNLSLSLPSLNSLSEEEAKHNLGVIKVYKMEHSKDPSAIFKTIDLVMLVATVDQQLSCSHPQDFRVFSSLNHMDTWTSFSVNWMTSRFNSLECLGDHPLTAIDVQNSVSSCVEISCIRNWMDLTTGSKSIYYPCTFWEP